MAGSHSQTETPLAPLPLTSLTQILDQNLQLAGPDGLEELHIKVDRNTGLRAIVAIHSTARGPAIGGCRCLPYSNSYEALDDVTRLAKAMSYKAAAHDLPHGGAKAVIMAPETIKDRKAFFEAFGEFVQTLQAKYITAEDSGTTPEDMDHIASRTPHVLGVSSNKGGYGDPSLHTALGVRRGIEAAVKFKLKRNDLEGIRVAIQGIGHVGYLLARDLHKHGAKLIVADKEETRVTRCIEEFGAEKVSPDEIYAVACDVFSPCALGSSINPKTLPQLQASIVAGAANNALSDAKIAEDLYKKNILYAPDFVINGGGLIHVATIYKHGEPSQGQEPILKIYDRLLELFARAQHENLSTHQTAEKIAEENIQRSI